MRYSSQKYLDTTYVTFINPLSPDSDQNQISPCSIHVESIKQVMNSQCDHWISCLDILKISSTKSIRMCGARKGNVCFDIGVNTFSKYCIVLELSSYFL